MPELAEVEYYRKQWDPGLGKIVTQVLMHADKRIFRGTDVEALVKNLTRAKLLSSQARAKQMLFRFNRGWLGIHLGMTGKLSVQPGSQEPGKHDHLVLVQNGQKLVFNDMRQFGRVKFHAGSEPPAFWTEIPPAVTSPEFTLEYFQNILKRHARLPIKGTLLLQTGFPGVGNWMADEILWRAKIAPRVSSGKIRKPSELWKQARFVCSEALRIVAKDFSDPPAGWLFHERWKRKGFCPIHKTPLRRETVAGRTTAWCPKCQR
jgi:formamidopyrimidine-DNA glycosylase